MRYLQLMVVLVLGVAGCTNTSGLPPAPPLPTPTRSANLAPYYVQVGDILDLRLLLNPELNEEVTVRPDGGISTTVVQNQQAAGMTIPELTAALTKDYSHDLQHPRLSILVKTFGATRIYVGGEVVAPGEFIEPNGSLSLTQAIARAGGVKYSSDHGDIFIIRRATPNSAPQLLSVRYDDVTHARDAAADVMLAPNDVVFVPRSGIGEVYAFWNQYVEQFAHPSFGFSYILGSSNAVVTGAPTATTVTH
jgi:polysaccharide export outer membrane protein